MPRPIPDTPARRILMQSIMWIILGATVGLAALVSHARRSSFEIKLSNPLTHRGLTVQLPSKWTISKTQDAQSSLLITATESKSNGDEDEQGGRVIRIIRDPLTTHAAPLEYAHNRLNPGNQVPTKESDVTIAGSPGIIISIAHMRPVKSLQDLQNGHLEGKLICAAAVPASRRPVAIELEGAGQVQPEEIDLLQRIAASITLDDEPTLLDDRQISVGDSIHLTAPDGFSLVNSQDPFLTVRELRPAKTDSDWRSINIIPIVLLPKDGRATLLTMLSLFDNTAFESAAAEQDNSGVWQINTETYLPYRAYALAKNGAGLLVIFHGGSDFSWIDTAWKSMRDKITFADDSKTDELIAAGTDEVKRIRQTGLAKLLPESNADLWWLNYIATPSRPIGWMRLVHGPISQTFEQRFLVEKQLNELTYSWDGSPDLKKFHSRSAFANTDLRDPENARQAWGMQTTFNNDRIALTPSASSKPFNFAPPPNYIPGGWLPFLLAKLPNHPMILRTDSFMDLAYAQPTDLFTVTIRPQPDTSRDTDDADSSQPLHCVQIEFSGTGETSRWFFRPDGTLDGIDYSQAQHLARRDEKEISTDFSRTPQLIP